MSVLPQWAVLVGNASGMNARSWSAYFASTSGGAGHPAEPGRGDWFAIQTWPCVSAKAFTMRSQSIVGALATPSPDLRRAHTASWASLSGSSKYFRVGHQFGPRLLLVSVARTTVR